jgi:hypothetical protein
MTTPTPNPPAFNPIPQGLDEVDRLLTQLDNDITELATTIGPIMSEAPDPLPADPGVPRERTGDSTVTRRLEDSSGSIRHLIGRVADLTRRIEL